jgi:hypothetical protein
MVSGDHSAFTRRTRSIRQAPLLLVPGRVLAAIVDVAEGPVVLEVIVAVALVEHVVP